MGFFYYCQDKKFAKCEECAEVVLRGGDNVKSFPASNLVSHLRVNHPIVYQRFCKHKDKKESQKQYVRKERIESVGFPALHLKVVKIVLSNGTLVIPDPQHSTENYVR